MEAAGRSFVPGHRGRPIPHVAIDQPRRGHTWRRNWKPIISEAFANLPSLPFVRSR
jgi:hypothetical protein